MTETVAPRTVPAPKVGLLEALRRETAECHREVEALADLAGTIRTPADYVQLLHRLHALHAGFERWLAADPWALEWAGLGVRIAAYRRAPQLTVDLEALGETTAPSPVALGPFPTFGHALGCLYVLEGSALGGRVIAGMIRTVLGDVPMTFLTGTGRAQTAPWTGLRLALGHFDDHGGDGDTVVRGAQSTFAAFGEHLVVGR